jgi:hypothetical protein
MGQLQPRTNEPALHLHVQQLYGRSGRSIDRIPTKQGMPKAHTLLTRGFAVQTKTCVTLSEAYDWSPSHDQRGMLRPFGTSSADWW